LSSRIQIEYCICVKRIITEDEQEERNGAFGKEQW
jgi:hypothetical protein